ncbi:hypothetical protein EOD39_16977 [Acipenser ruthenus]|uniref:Uncharacterized protein n=1 Tax=Acipenser ruthenus TaxID=7906 RepID=A0A444V4K6_ACIRT|nr:hypothetical protein EOD39_16977 [Acipenser ruthenus]
MEFRKRRGSPVTMVTGVLSVLMLVVVSEFVKVPSSVNCTVGQDCILNCTFNVTAGGGWGERYVSFYLTAKALQQKVAKARTVEDEASAEFEDFLKKTEGQDIAIHLSKKITKVSVKIKQKVKLFNTRRSRAENLPHELQYPEVIHVDNPLDHT